MSVFFLNLNSKSEPFYEKTQMAIRSDYLVLEQRHIDEQAIVTKTIQPTKKGRVQFRATTWFAVCPQEIILLPDVRVRVIGYYSATTLIVMPLLDSAAQLPEFIDVA